MFCMDNGVNNNITTDTLITLKSFNYEVTDWTVLKNKGKQFIPTCHANGNGKYCSSDASTQPCVLLLLLSILGCLLPVFRNGKVDYKGGNLTHVIRQRIFMVISLECLCILKLLNPFSTEGNRPHYFLLFQHSVYPLVKMFIIF